MNRKQRRARQQSAKVTQSPTSYAIAGSRAMQKGDVHNALENYARAVQGDPQNHSHKVRLAYLLKDAHFTSPNQKMKGMVLNCLKTSNLDHQNLAKPWYSLILCDPNFIALQAAIHGKDFSEKKLRANLLDPFFLEGLEKLIICNYEFETAIHRIASEHANSESKMAAFKKAYGQYCENVEYVGMNAPKQDLYKIDDTIPSLSTAQNETSKAVQEQYEKNPYPRWVSVNVQQAPKNLADQKIEYLMAGCGTGYGLCATAMLYPNAKITAIDISRASLTYAKTKAKELGYTNIEFIHADILDLKNLNRKFDLINCSGVLHHMEDPIAGWKSLASKLKPDGMMSIGLYSELGRQDIVAARNVIAEHGFESTHEGINEARKYLGELPQDHPARAILNRRDFYTMSSCRDLIFHVWEHRFTISQIVQSLDKLGLKFDGFEFLDTKIPLMYAVQYPNDPKKLDLKNWAAFEEKNPTAFRNMYNFRCSHA
ncbi:MAG: methyltransferase domain-containing protein [Alphaproteobacteria bacterium]|nr:methyltransferase domain-containing protein [Alphaproteobacteria bacterium]